MRLPALGALVAVMAIPATAQSPHRPVSAFPRATLLSQSSSGAAGIGFGLNVTEVYLADGSVLLSAASQAPWAVGGAGVLFLSRGIAAADDGGLVLAADTTTWGGPSRVLVRWDAPDTWTILEDRNSPLPWAPSFTYGRSCHLLRMLSNGELAFTHSNDVAGAQALSIDRTLVFSPTDFVTALDGGSYQCRLEDRPSVSMTGAHWGGLATSATFFETFVIVDGAVVLQEGQPVPSAPAMGPVTELYFRGVQVNDAGQWVTSGKSMASEDVSWVLVNGEVAAQTGDLVVAGSTESWSGDMYGASLNELGDWLIIGETDFPTVTRNKVVVLNGTTLVARRGAPIDVDGDGQVPDGVFIEDFIETSFYAHQLTDDLEALLQVDTQDTNGQPLGTMTVRVRIDDEIGETYCTAVTNSSGMAAVLVARGRIAVERNELVLSASDLPTNTFGFFITSLTPGLVPMPGASAGTLCLGGGIGRDVGPGGVQSSGATGSVDRRMDLTAIPQPSGLVPVSQGDTWHVQYWFRDLVGATESNFSDGVRVTFQ